MDITIVQYNNYFNNNVISPKPNLTDYTTGHAYQTITDIQFNRQDDVNTTFVFNYNDVVSDDIDYDYCLLSDNGLVVSRWFILEANWNREKQRILTLRRDLRADFKDLYYNATLANGPDIYIERGICATTDEAIYNSEALNFSRKLNSTTEIWQDVEHTNGYIVGFVANNSPEIKIPSNPNVLSVNSIEELPFYSAYVASNNGKCITTPTARTITLAFSDTNELSNTGYLTTSTGSGSSCGEQSYPSIQNFKTYARNTTWTAIRNAISSYKPGNNIFEDFFTDHVVLESPTSWNNKLIYVKNTNSRYKVSVSVGTASTHQLTTGINERSYVINYWNEIASMMTAAGIINGFLDGSGTGGDISDWANRSLFYSNITITLNSAADSDFRLYTYPAQTMSLSTDLPYNMFYCEATGTNRKDMAYLLSALKSYGYLYDAQIVPFIPINNTDDHKQTCTFNNTTYYFITRYQKQFTKAITNPISGTTGASIKKNSLECIVRLCASDYSASWEFNPAKAGYTTGSISIDFYQTILPFSTQIYATPNLGLNGIYGGTTYLNNQGLIYTINNSLPLSSNEWSSYQAQNSAYSQSFNRQIENITTMNDLQHKQAVIEAIVGTAQGTAYGGIAGLKTGFPKGGMIGSAIGTVASAAGGIADVYLGDKARKENLDHTIDQHSYSMQNIQMRPNTLVSTGINTKTNHICPIVEVYTTTTSEDDYWTAYSAAYAWNIGRIGKFKSYLKSDGQYMKVQLIRTKTTATTVDTHLLDELNMELAKGGYYYGYTG